MAVLKVGVACPDPPFNTTDGGGLDVELMTALARKLGDEVGFIGPESPRGPKCPGGPDCAGIFDRLRAGAYDCVIGGATITPERLQKVAFLPPYLISGQGLAVDTGRLPNVRSVDHLTGLTIGVQRGDTSEPVAQRLVAEGKAGRVRVYDCDAVGTAITDLTSGGCDAVLKLAPVLGALIQTVPGVELVQRGLSVEDIAIAVNPDDEALLARLHVAQAELEQDGTLQLLRRRWLGNPYVDQRLGVL